MACLSHDAWRLAFERDCVVCGRTGARRGPGRPRMKDPSDWVELDADDFRRIRAYLAPSQFGIVERSGTSYPPPSDLIDQAAWEGIMDLPTHVALATSSDTGSDVSRLHELHSDWIFSWREPACALHEACVLAGEEFDALILNVLHGYYRQAIGCLRNALETMTIVVGLAVTTATSSLRSGGEDTRSRSDKREPGCSTVLTEQRSRQRSLPTRCLARTRARGSSTATRSSADTPTVRLDTTTQTSGKAMAPCTDPCPCRGRG